MAVAEGWKVPEQPTYRCPVHVTRDEAGVYSAVSANLPGVGSCGGTLQEAMDNAAEALAAAIGVYLESGPIPWLPRPREAGFGTAVRWLNVAAPR